MPSSKSIIGGEIVSQTLDKLNDGSYVGCDDDSPECVGASVVTKTLDYLNSGKKKNSAASAQQAMSDSYNFNKDILSAVYAPKGALTDVGT